MTSSFFVLRKRVGYLGLLKCSDPDPQVPKLSRFLQKRLTEGCFRSFSDQDILEHDDDVEEFIRR